jgi:hypothetical protein
MLDFERNPLTFCRLGVIIIDVIPKRYTAPSFILTTLAHIIPSVLRERFCVANCVKRPRRNLLAGILRMITSGQNCDLYFTGERELWRQFNRLLIPIMHVRRIPKRKKKKNRGQIVKPEQLEALTK